MGLGNGNTDILCANEIIIITRLIPHAYLQFCQIPSAHMPSNLVPPLSQAGHISALALVLCTLTSSHYQGQMSGGLRFQNCLWVVQHFHHSAEHNEDEQLLIHKDLCTVKMVKLSFQKLSSKAEVPSPSCLDT